jgi:hypothetical protein
MTDKDQKKFRIS